MFCEIFVNVKWYIVYLKSLQGQWSTSGTIAVSVESLAHFACERTTCSVMVGMCCVLREVSLLQWLPWNMAQGILAPDRRWGILATGRSAGRWSSIVWEASPWWVFCSGWVGKGGLAGWQVCCGEELKVAWKPTKVSALAVTQIGKVELNNK